MSRAPRRTAFLPGGSKGDGEPTSTGPPWVLVVDGGSGQNRSAVAAVRALGMAGYRAAVTVSGRYSLAASSRFCGRAVPTPLAGQQGFAAAVQTETAARPYLATLPASDAAILALSAAGQELVDKSVLAELAAGAGLSVPSSQRFEGIEDLLADAGQLDYPCVVKAAVKPSACQRPARHVTGPEDLVPLRDASGPFIVQPFVPGEMCSTAGVMWRGRLVAAVHQRHLRLWPPVCGDACAALTTEPDRDLEEKLEHLLSDYDGIFQAEFVGPYLLDLNPRVYGSMLLAVSAGVNPVHVYCALVAGAPVPLLRGRAGVRYRWWEGELRHAYRHRSLYRHRSGGQPILATGLRELRRAWAPSARPPLDPGPTLTRLRYALNQGRQRFSATEPSGGPSTSLTR